jgi:RNA polymerase sigma-70 factor (ECF subfamily)
MFARWQQTPSDPPYADPQAFSELYERTHLLVFRYIYGLHNGPQQEVEDLAAETFTRAWNARLGFSGEERAAVGWLLRIARNLVIDTHRRVQYRGIPDDLDEALVSAPDATPELQSLQREQTHHLWQLLHTLPAHQREMLVLRYMLGWQVQEIATHMNMAENTVSQNIRRVLARLRERWHENFEG